MGRISSILTRIFEKERHEAGERVTWRGQKLQKRQRTAALQDAVARDRTLLFPRGPGVRLSSAALLFVAAQSIAGCSFAQEHTVRPASWDSEDSLTNTAPRAKMINVRDYGAIGDGKALDTDAIQRAIDECGDKAVRGTVVFPAGTYLSKPIFLRSHLTLELEKGAILKATDEPGDFDDPKAQKGVIAFINGNNLTNIFIDGKGTIDGSGERWWPPVKEAKKNGQPEPRRRPRMIVFSKCKEVAIQGVTLQNSPGFHLVPTDCEDVVINRITVRAPADSPNTDAIDPSACKRVLIANCVLDVGDDNIALKSGHSVAGRSAACEDITVVSCTFLNGHGMSIGSETVGGVRNLGVTNCTFRGTVSGLRIKSHRGRGGLVENISYRDIKMTDVKIPINITSYYPKIPKEDTTQPITPETPIYRNIRISNLTATSLQSAGFIVGLPECVVSNVMLENVSISAPAGLTVRNAKEIHTKNVKIEASKGEAFLMENASVQRAESGD